MESKTTPKMKYFTLIFILFQVQMGYSQESKMRPIKELINNEDPGFVLVEEWMKGAENEIEVLERDLKKAETALFQTQVTTRSIMGAIVYETGGILVDNGWIRILGSGSERMTRSLPEWNKGKSFKAYGDPPAFLLVADDAIGGLFALNGGGFGSEGLGKIFYFSPDLLEWEPLEIGYSEFIHWTFTGDIEQFYEGLRWKKWKKEVEAMGSDRAMSFFPFLWTEYEDLEKLVRKEVPMAEMWSFLMDTEVHSNQGGK